jgi:ABC-type antimicrobial peptide transport system permease subunit
MLIKCVKKYISFPDIYINVSGSGVNFREKNYKIVGFHISPRNDKGYNGNINIIVNSNDELYKLYTTDAGKYFLMIGEITDNSTSGLKKFVEFNYDESGAYAFKLKNNVMNSVNNINDFIETAAKIFLYVGIGFAVFASLLLLNFITVSISYKKREIGILRAIGARGMDVFKIFFSEAFIIALINFVLAFIGCFVACFFINRMFRNNYGFLITILHVGFRQLILMFGVSFVVAFISSFIPVYLTARKKPIDAIRSAE